MDVRVCGPNLNDQSKGSFHVHAVDCSDLYNYGPGKRNGGDEHGLREMLVKDASVYKVVEATYTDQIDEAVSDEQSRENIANDYASDFWFAPCCGKLPWRSETVFECWVDGDRNSFAKFKSDAKFGVAQWVIGLLAAMVPPNHIHIVAHYQDEYSESS